MRPEQQQQAALLAIGCFVLAMEGIRAFLIFAGCIFSITCAYFVALSFVADDDLLQRHRMSIGAPVPPTPEASDRVTKQHDKISWRPYKDDDLVVKYNKVSKWGSYRPGFYFGMKTSTPEDGNTMSTGIMWSDVSRKQFRHDTKQGELARFEWVRHDGKHYGKQVLSDASLKLDLTTSFVANHVDTELTWIQKIEINTSKAAITNDESSFPLLFYFGSDCADNIIRSTCLTKTEMKDMETFDFHGPNGEIGIQLVGRKESSSWFVLTAVAVGGESLSFATLNGVDIYGGSAKLLEESSGGRRHNNNRPNKKSKQLPLYNEFGDLRNEIVGGESNSANFIAFQTTFKAGVHVFFVLQEFPESIASSAEQIFQLVANSLQGNSVSSYWDKLENYYSEDFEKRFADHMSTADSTDTDIEDKLNFSHNEIESVKVALSSLLGGVGYFEGMPSIEFAAQSELDLKHFNEIQSESLAQLGSTRTKLFTGTPSRTAFPRGFLWDEGFHQMVMSHWDLDITFRVISDWLNAMYVSPIPGLEGELMGWIPREMILGDDSSRRVPNEFIVQRATIANPPTFLLVLESLLNRINKACHDGEQVCPASSLDEQSKIVEFVSDIYPRLHYWIQWFRYTQQGEVPGSFRWRGRSLSDNKVVPNTLASGLDDYPRSAVPSFEERHVDLLCWMIKGYESMSRIEGAMIASGLSLPSSVERIIKNTKYSEQAAFLKSQLDAHHWSNNSSGYFDYGLANESAVFVKEVMFRCATNEQQSVTDIYVPISLLESKEPFCPETHPRPLYPLGDGNGGYLMREKISAEGFSLDFIPRVGYVSIFPFILKSVHPSSPTMESLLNMMEDPALLYTPYGLRSIATTDVYYLRRNAAGDAPYWRGPIWINVNYLALSALKYYSSEPGPFQERCGKLYHKMRKNIVKNILKEHIRTGFFWEQYDDRNGLGMRGHPFTGWTATVVNMVFERY